MIFISHSSKDFKLIEALNTFLLTLGIKIDNIFCSSIEGQGVDNGERISDRILDAIQNSSIIIYVITQNFIKSTYCTQELGNGWFFQKDKKIFIFKSEDVNNSELNGFINSDYKYSAIDSNGLSLLTDTIIEKFIISLKHSQINNAINSFLEKAKIETATLLEEKDKSAEEITKQQIEMLEKQYYQLAIGAKKVIADIFYSYDGVGYYSLANGVIGSLELKSFISRTTIKSTIDMKFAYELQPWVFDFIYKNKDIEQELKDIYNSNITK